MPNLNHSKKLFVRVALVSGSTVAVLVGAQTVAMLGQKALGAAPISAAPEATTPPPPTIIPTVEIIHEAPSIIALNQPPASAAQPVNLPAANPVILPPNPQAIIAPPAQVVVQQQQAPAVSRSSR